ncbi:response regulator [Pseudoxanthomonas sp. 10H]|uniref:response regulator n=1 Tax=Pseudoxanthomonas sp. 10H TaxID=3242729 RepID=UPI0035567AC1
MTVPPAPGLRVILADDHPVVRGGVRALLEQAGGIRITAEAATAGELFAAVSRGDGDLVLTDFSMPGGDAADGLSMLGRLRAHWPELPVVVLTMAGNTAVLRTILEAGVLGLLNKSDALTELAMAIHAASQGRRYVGTSIRALLEPASPGLSQRETEVLRLFASGLTVSQIARRLNRSVKTISRQKTDAMAKLGLRSDLDIYAYARQNGLLF